MPPLLSKNCVTSGKPGFYCLVCLLYLPEEEKARVHIKEATHITNCASTPYFTRYRRDGIRNVTGIYFCDICDLTIPCCKTLVIHLEGLDHFENKRRVFTLLAKNCVIISDIAYYCLACSTSLYKGEDALEHIEDPVHIVKSKSCTYLENYEKECIRDVKGAYFCELCNMTIHGIRALKDVEMHVFEIGHLLRKPVYSRLLKMSDLFVVGYL